MQEGRNASRDRQRYRKTDIQIYIQTNRNKDVQTYTDKQTDRQYMSEKTDRRTERPIFTHMVHTYITVHKKDIQTDRQTGQTEKNDKQTNKQTDKQTDRQYMSEKQTDVQKDQYSHIW